ncbi:MAG TPA: BrnT family toxin [Acetobacteraceae bacterium]|nr:BrnT family toxin [Acetobacteraceae bacterium]
MHVEVGGGTKLRHGTLLPWLSPVVVRAQPCAGGAFRQVRDHRISFKTARAAFADVFAIERVDRRHDDQEERFVLLGMAGTRLLFVSYTLRDDRVRIISARKAEPHERRQYHNENP